MTPDVAFYIYATAVRACVCVAGTLCIWWGYKLFVSGVYKVPPRNGMTRFSGRIGDYEFKLATAAPGAVLAIFGGIIVVSILAASPPQRIAASKVEAHENGESMRRVIEFSETLRSRSGDEMADLVREAQAALNEHNIPEATAKLDRFGALAAEPMYKLSVLRTRAERYEDAEKLAVVAAMLSPGNPTYAAHLADIRERLRGK